MPNEHGYTIVSHCNQSKQCLLNIDDNVQCYKYLSFTLFLICHYNPKNL